jgi:acetoin utilization deacetylase AcuC-like enzyme
VTPHPRGPPAQLALAALTLLNEGAVRKVLIVDLDVHQGDGTAAILGEEARAVTFSMHSARAFPLRKRRSTLDVSLPNTTSDREYMRALRRHLPPLLDGGGTPPGLVLLDAGVDVHERDMVREFCRGHLGLSDDGLAERDRYVLSSCLERRIPVATVIGGGYSRDVEELARRHAIHVEVAHELYSNAP